MNVFCYFQSPIGRLLLTSDRTALTGLYMEPSRKAQSTDGWSEDPMAAPLSEALRQLSEYFAGTRREFDLPLRMQGTEFQQRVWRELTEIPYGQTWSYGELAKRIDNPSASRAVGLANGRNPISILVPCHRVIGADGSLTGYGGGLERKRWLLAHEGLHWGENRGQLSLLDQGQRDSEDRAAAVGSIRGDGRAAVKLGDQPHDVQP
jgi:methylated-DNA-[protein]-cysteine S-methyltransferase